MRRRARLQKTFPKIPLPCKRSEMHNRDLRDSTLLQVAATKTKIHPTYIHHLFIHVMPRSTKDSLKRARAACC